MSWCACQRLVSKLRHHRGADNAAFYISNGVPFVMGTTGGDREKLLADVQAAGIRAVIAPQMGKQARPPVQRLPAAAEHIKAVGVLRYSTE